jgi:type III restriction enzyme
MPLRDLEYHARVLTRFDEYLTELAAQKAKADKIAAANEGESDPDLIRPVPNFPATTWRALKEADFTVISTDALSMGSRNA